MEYLKNIIKYLKDIIERLKDTEWYKNTKKWLKLHKFITTLLSVLLVTILVAISTDMVFIHISKMPIIKYFMFSKDQLEPFILTVTLITALIGVVYSAKLDREAQKHSESSWREKLLEFEQKPYYTIEDLFVLNSFINPTNSKGIDQEINEELIEIAIQYSRPPQKNKEKFNYIIEKRENTHPVITKNIHVLSYPCLYLENKKDSIKTLFNFQYTDYYINTILAEGKTLLLTPEEMTIIRKLAHKLLKEDWDKY